MTKKFYGVDPQPGDRRDRVEDRDQRGQRQARFSARDRLQSGKERRRLDEPQQRRVGEGDEEDAEA